MTRSKSVLVGTHRQVPVADTLARLLPMLDGFGITRIADVTGLDEIGIATVVVVRPNARSLSVSQGKGTTREAAMVSGVMEAIEQWHAERIEQPLFLGSYSERRNVSRVIDVTCLPGYVRDWTPEARILWIAGRTRLDPTPVEVPFELVHLDMRVPLPPGSGYFPIGSNGLASGNSLEEAVVHGACELIERDAMALFYSMNPASQAERRVRLASVSDVTCRQLLAAYDNASVGVALWDITTDVGVPAYFCSTVEREANPFRRIGVARGFGCHRDRAVALARALCEAAQSRLTRIAGSRDDIQAADFERIRGESAIALQQQQLAEESFATRLFEDSPTQGFSTVEEDWAWLEERLARSNLGSIHYVDLSRGDMGIAVVRVIILGLEGAPEVPGYRAGPRALRVRTSEGLT